MIRLVIAKALLRALNLIGAQEIKLRDKELEIQNLRAHLMELRISNEAPKGSVGWMVSAFVPDSVVASLQSNPERIADFQKVVAEALIANALRGILKLSKEGKVQALIFEPVTSAHQKVLRSRPWFEATTKAAEQLTLPGALMLAEEAVERSKRNAKLLGMYHND